MRVLPLISLFSLSSAFLLPTLPSSTSPLSSTRGRALASSASEELSRKEKSKEQVRSLLKGLGELDDGENSESTGSKRKVRVSSLAFFWGPFGIMIYFVFLLTRLPVLHAVYSSMSNTISINIFPLANLSPLPFPPSSPPYVKEKREGLEAARRALSDKDSMKLEPEVVFFEGPPHWSEVG